METETIQTNGATAPEATPMEQSPASIFEKAIVLRVSLRRLGIRKKVSSGAVKTDADPEAIHVSKELIDSEPYQEIVTLDGEIRAFIESYCLPNPLFSNGGTYLVALGSVEHVDERLTAFETARDRAVDRFCDWYSRPSREDEDRARLGSLWNPKDYPPVARVRAAFSIERQWIAFQTPKKLQTISATIWKREQEKAQAAMQSATAELTNMMRAQMADLVNHMIDRLTPTEDGKAKIFKNTLVSNFAEYLDHFNFKNITDDQELAKLVDDARAALKGITPEALRETDNLRAKTAEAFTTIKAQLDGMLIDKPSRKINFDA